jgi:hypothetical protein
VLELGKQYPDPYWKHHAESASGMIERVGDAYEFVRVDTTKMQDKGTTTK